METIKLDLIPGKKMPSLHASQYDDGRDYHIDLTENRVPYVLDGTETISLTVRKCDNTLVTMDIANTFADKSYIEFRTTEQMNACAGFNYGEITLEKNGDKISSLNFYLQVEGAPDEGGITSQSEINNLNRQITDEVDRILPDKIAEEVPQAVDDYIGDNYYDKTEVDEIASGKASVEALEQLAEAIPTKTSELTNDSGFAAIDDNSTNSDKTWSASKINEVKTLLDDVTIVESGETIIDVSPFTLTEGYIGQNGNYSASTSYHYTNKIPVQAGDKIYVYKADGTTQVGSYRFVTCYHNNVAITEKGGQNVSSPFVVPAGIEEVILSISNVSAPASAKIQRGQSVKELINQPQVDALLSMSASAKPNGLEYEFNYTAGTTFQSEELFEDLCAYRVCFFAKITSITDIATIGKGLGDYYGGGIGFDDTNLYLYQSSSATSVSTKAHGLTLKDYVAITLDNKYTIEATITISTNGGRYEWAIPTWRSNYGKLSFSASDNMTECKLSYTCEGLIKDTWLYGDSYFSNSDSKRWTKYLVASGRTNYLLNAYGGRSSASALASLKVDLKMNRVPRRIVWCLGMNDKDGASAPNQGWQNSVEEVMQICEKFHIELVLATIPNVPHQNADNTKKNAYVRASGYRYIDFAKAVSLNGDSTWYDNMLYSDNIHPDTQGAIALYSQAVATVPELLM